MLETKRLILRQWAAGDIPAFVELNSDYSRDGVFSIGSGGTSNSGVCRNSAGFDKLARVGVLGDGAKDTHELLVWLD